MNNSLPTAKSAQSPDDRDRFRRIVQQRQLCGLANDTKWDELIAAMRTKEEQKNWTPDFRCKCIDSNPSQWDGEWFYHLPFPLISVEWLDLSFIQKTHRGRLLAPEITDHSNWVEELIKQIGFEYQKGSSMFRIFGYSPKSLDLFDQKTVV
jgi:hypothetical protein